MRIILYPPKSDSRIMFADRHIPDVTLYCVHGYDNIVWVLFALNVSTDRIMVLNDSESVQPLLWTNVCVTVNGGSWVEWPLTIRIVNQCSHYHEPMFVLAMIVSFPSQGTWKCFAVSSVVQTRECSFNEAWLLALVTHAHVQGVK